MPVGTSVRAAMPGDARGATAIPAAAGSLHTTVAEAGRRETDAATVVASDYSESPSHLPPPPHANEHSHTTTNNSKAERTKRGRRPSSKPRAAVFSKRKGVRYRDDGAVLSCRFCEILRLRDEPFLYEDERVAVFRPLRPIVVSHILIVPRAHIRNIHQLTSSHDELLRHMKLVAESVLRAMPLCSGAAADDADCLVASVSAAAASSSAASNDADLKGGRSDTLAASGSAADAHEPETDPAHSDESSKGTDDDEDSCAAAPPSAAPPFKFAFHAPPFNSIDHVHMHAFRDERMGVFGRVKYCTESWWCRSFADVLARLTSPASSSSPPPPPRDVVEAARPLLLAASAVS